MLVLSLLWGIFESKKTFRQTYNVEIMCSNDSKGTFTKAWTASPFKFQWQSLTADDFLGPGFISMPPDFRST